MSLTTNKTKVTFMKRSSLIALLLTLPLAVMAQTAVFTDTFGSSTTNQTSTPGGSPTVSSTSYDIASTKAATGGANGPYCRPGDFRISLNGTTTSGMVEAQALFAASPVSLVTVGDYINLTYTFTNTTGTLLAGGTASFIFNGLYNSGGSVPVAGGLANSGLTSTPGSAFAAGNCANWQGYVSRIANGGASQAYTRPVQTNFPAGPSANQDLVGNGAGGGTYTNLPGVAFDTDETATVTLTSGSTYTISYTIALTAAGTLTVTNNLFSGVGTGGTLIFSQTNTASGSTNITSSFNGLAIGLRNNGTSFNPTMDISKITVSSSIFGSPGPSFNVTGGGAGCPGDSFPIGLSGSVTTNAYRVYTNGVFDGAVAVQTGTGSALSFGTLSVVGTNTVVASNTVSGFTGLMSGSAVISILAGPVITTQPAPVLVATNGIGAFTVTATGSTLHYQWYKNGAGLSDGGHVSGSQTSTLTISPATTADVATTANGYYVIITNNCSLSATSTTNALTLQPAGKLVWQGANLNTNWDLAITPNWTNSAGGFVVFNSGDKVTFDDSSTNPVVTMVGNLAPTSVTYNASQNYFFRGGGGLVGSGSMLVNGAGTLTLSNASTYTYSGGTVISNGTVAIRNGGQQTIGTGPVTLAGGKLEVGVASGSATSGLSNNISVTASSTLQWDGNGTYALVVLTPLTGTPGATLTLQNFLNNTATPDRVRLYAAFTNDSPVVINTAGNQIELAPYLASGNQVFNGVISGNGGRFVPRGAGNLILNAANTFNDSGVNANGNGPSGYSVYFSGGNVGVGADSALPTSSPLGTGNLGINVGVEGGTATLFSSGGAHTVGNPVNYTSATNTVTFVLGGSNNLTLSGTFALANATDTAGTNRTLQVNNTALTTLSGVIGDNGFSSGITKTGAGTLALNGVNTYTGSTLVSAGTLLVNGQVDVGGVTVTNGTLGGGGTILGPVLIQSPGVLSPGASIGTLTISNSLTLAGNSVFEVNKSVAPSNDTVVVSGLLTNAGPATLTVSNLGPALVIGDSFKLFSAAVANGGALTVTGAGVNWTNKLAVNGSIQVLSLISTVATNSPNIVFSVGGGTNLTLSWPADHIGWRLQAQTNSLANGLNTASNAWFTVPGSTTVNQTNFIINPANGAVFYRLIYP